MGSAGNLTRYRVADRQDHLLKFDHQVSSFRVVPFLFDGSYAPLQIRDYPFGVSTKRSIGGAPVLCGEHGFPLPLWLSSNWIIVRDDTRRPPESSKKLINVRLYW